MTTQPVEPTKIWWVVGSLHIPGTFILTHTEFFHAERNVSVSIVTATNAYLGFKTYQNIAGMLQYILCYKSYRGTLLKQRLDSFGLW